VNRTAATAALPDPTFDGFYVQGSWILTGETRRYDVATGAFQAPRPFVPFSSAGGPGAWELALRYSRLDLDFHSGAAGTGATADAIRGGVQDIWTFGVNWYINANVKLMLNWLHIDVDRLNPAGAGNLLPFGPTPATPPLGVQIGQDLDIYGLRRQYSF
jgi:phosphate-selective porin OprO and OprP